MIQFCFRVGQLADLRQASFYCFLLFLSSSFQQLDLQSESRKCTFYFTKTSMSRFALLLFFFFQHSRERDRTMTYFTRRTCNFSRSRSFVPRTINLFLAGNSSEEGGLFVRACARISDQRFHVTSREAQKNVKKEDETKFQVQVSHRAVQMISKNVVSDNFIVLSSSLVLLIIYSEYIFYFILNEARERERERSCIETC